MSRWAEPLIAWSKLVNLSDAPGRLDHERIHPVTSRQRRSRRTVNPRWLPSRLVPHASAPEPNSSRPTSFKSPCFDSPARTTSARGAPAWAAPRTRTHRSIPASVRRQYGSHPRRTAPCPTPLEFAEQAPRPDPRARSSAFQSTCSRVLDPTYFFAALIVLAKGGSIQSGLLPSAPAAATLDSIFVRLPAKEKRASRPGSRFSTR